MSRNCEFKCTKFMFGFVVTRVSKLCAAVHRRDLDLLRSAGGGRRKGGAGAAGHLHLITATSATRWWRFRHVGLFGTVSSQANNDVLSHYYWSCGHLMLGSVCSVKLCELLQSTEAFCHPFPLLDFKLFNQSGVFWRKWKHA